MELNDEAFEGAVGGEGEERPRYENATVTGPFGDDPEQNGCYRIIRDGCSSEDAAHYDAINLVPSGTRVKVQLVGMGRWQIVEFL